MNVEIMSHTPNAIKVAFTAIRTCYSPLSQEEVWHREFDKYKRNRDDHIRLIKQIVSHGHTSTLEHISFTFAINDVSRSLLAQLTRHRIGFSYSVQSQRYVKQTSSSKHGGVEVVVPPAILENIQARDIYMDIVDEIQTAYNKLVSMGIKPEDARYVFPNGATTNITLTVNLRAFLDFYLKRNKNTHAQWEIANLAEAMRNEIEIHEPWTADLFKMILAAPEQEESGFDFRKLFKKKYVRIMGNSETTEEMVWKSENHLYTMEEDGSFNCYSWKGFRRTLTAKEMEETMVRYYEKV